MVLLALYVLAMWWIDRKNGAFHRLIDHGNLLLMMLPAVFATYVVRYWRWSWLLKRRGDRVAWTWGLPAYLAGFALTATPGKAGELLRIRYFSQAGVGPGRTMAVFVFERACDLLVILALSLLAAPVFPTLGWVSAAVLVLVGTLFGLAAWPTGSKLVDGLANKMPGQGLPRLLHLAATAIDELRQCLSASQLLVSLTAGLIAWGVTAAIFVSLCTAMGLDLPTRVALGIYPLAMLVGALSFVPGGVGTTELAIVLMLGRMNVPTPQAIAIAVGVRMVTLWFAVAVGVVSVLGLEYRTGKNTEHPSV